MKHVSILQTGQDCCYNSEGLEIMCRGSGQDGEYRIGAPWPSPRFTVQDEIVYDHLTGLVWTRSANPYEYPVAWQEAFDQTARWNREKFLGFDDWRLPNRRELRSLMSHQSRKPSFPTEHPFTDIFLGWYWTSTTAAIHLEGARMFYGRKEQYSFFRPVRGTPNNLLARTGQKKCFDTQGMEILCSGSGQDGESRLGAVWPEPRFKVIGEVVHDHLTGLNWDLQADATGGPVTWQQALDSVRRLNDASWRGKTTWRLPNINELESLVDCSAHSPALPHDHPFAGLQEGYWSSTTSFFETDWAWVLYLQKGACGVGYKPGKTFYVWPVCSD